jgi:Tfp pilus assembly pilus retraction ATPase PilT
VYVNHREVGVHTQSFGAAAWSVREDPDIILVGEMRDLETIWLAVEAATPGLAMIGRKGHKDGKTHYPANPTSHSFV